MRGLVAYGGQAVPVLQQTFLGESESAPDVLVVLDLGGRLLAVPGVSPSLVELRDQGPDRAGGSGFWSGEVDDGGVGAACVDVARLYTALGLHYNWSGSDRGPS